MAPTEILEDAKTLFRGATAWRGEEGASAVMHESNGLYDGAGGRIRKAYTRSAGETSY